MLLKLLVKSQQRGFDRSFAAEGKLLSVGSPPIPG
jgi:hypothetical protein